ncbi:MFS transporter [Streptomyces sp. NBC_00083]|uniref:MFS transporter n=1 Tax=Streptomyces sp. NBC_00083 TaxID=2975647 RepID=UPI002257FE4E|nr:MFS transporter [Streptomyces sp. NBC_00083]MCX5388367.1 MFS transporter [Streptomyces sp. NBC_00083]
MSVYIRRNFLLSFLASFISLFGSKLLMISYASYVFMESGSATLAAIIFGADWIANLFVGLFAAQYIDRQNAKTLLIRLNAAAAVVTLLFLAFLGSGAFAGAVAIIFVRSLIKSAVSNARVKALVQFFDERETDMYSPVFNSSLPLAMALAGAVGVFILKFVGLTAVVWIDASAFVVAAVMMAFVRPHQGRLDESLRAARVNGKGGLLSGARGAFALMAREESVASAVFYIVLSVTAFQATYESLITVIPEVWFRWGESGTALFFTFESIAIMAGIFLYQFFNRRGFITPAREKPVNMAAVAASTVCYAAMPAAHGNIYLCVALFSLMVLCGEVIWVHQFKLMIARTPDSQISSVVGVQTAIGYSLMAVFAFVFARGMDGLGVNNAVFADIALIVALVVGWEIYRTRLARSASLSASAPALAEELRVS